MSKRKKISILWSGLAQNFTPSIGFLIEDKKSYFRIMFMAFSLLILSTASYTSANDINKFVDPAAVEDTARALGYSEEVVAKSMYFQNRFYSYVEKWETEYKDRITSAWVDPIPATKGYIRFKGNAPKKILDTIISTSFFSSENTEIFEHAKYSRNQINERLMRAGSYMETTDLKNFSAGYDNKSDKIVITIYAKDDAYVRQRDRTPDLLEKIKKDLSDNQLSDIEVQIDNTHSQSIEPHSVNGGGQFQTCSGSFTTANGVFSAGHCVSGPQSFYTDYYGTGAPIIGTTYGFGQIGDYAHYQLSALGTAKFNTPSIKDVKIVRSTVLMEGLSVCLYSPARKSSYCGFTIQSVNQTATFLPTGTYVEHLVKVNGKPGQAGDSGAPWYNGSSAFGIHVGGNPVANYSYFTALDYAQQMTGFYAEKVDACPTC